MDEDSRTNGSAPTHIEIQSGLIYGEKRYCGIFKRPIYLVSATFSLLLWAGIIYYITMGVIDEDNFKKIYYEPIIVWLLYVIEVLFCKTSRYLWNLNVVENVVTYVNRIKKVSPDITIRCVCSHSETKIRYITETYTDSFGNMQTRNRTETDTRTVITYTESERVDYGRLEDDSGEMTEGIFEWNAVRIECTKSWRAGDEISRRLIDRQIELFNDRNRYRDVNYSYSVDFDLAGFKSCLLSLVDLTRRPLALRWSVYALISIVLSLSWSYKLWFCRQTAKGRFHFTKLVYKTNFDSDSD